MSFIAPAAIVILAALAAAPPSTGSIALGNFAGDFAETEGFSRGQPHGLAISPDGSKIIYLESGPRSNVLKLYVHDVAANTDSELLTPEQLLGGGRESLSVEERAERERLRQTEMGFTSFQLSRDGSKILVPLSGKLYLVDLASRKPQLVYQGAEPALDPKLSPEADRVAFVAHDDLHIVDVASGKDRALTSGGDRDHLHGLAEFVASEELERFSGFWWSPEGRFLAYTDVDQTGVEHLSVADPAHPEDEVERFAYPRPGKPNAKLRLGLIPAAGGATSWVKWDTQKFPYLVQVTWHHLGTPLTLLVATRDQRELEVLAVDPFTGNTRVLVTDRDPAWLDTWEATPTWTPDGKSLLFVRQSGEWPQLELLDRNGHPVRTLAGGAPGDSPIQGLRALIKVDASQAWVQAGADPLETQLWRVPLDGSPPTQMTQGPAEHWAGVAEKSDVWVEGANDEAHLDADTLRDGSGKTLGQLKSQAEKPPFAANVEYTSVDVGDSILPALILRPRNFQAGKKYPVIDAVYGGPLDNEVTRSARSHLLDQWDADHGFIVVAIDNRGTPRHGRTWEKAISGELGTVPLADQAAAVRALAAKYPEMDIDRVGITGWSFGGYLSALAVAARPDVFKCGVAIAPVTDWSDYDTTYTERYLGTPQQSADAYARSSVLTYAPNLARPLLVLHGTSDDNVYFLHSLRLMDTLFRNGRHADFVPLIDFTHLVNDPKMRQVLEEQRIGYFVKHLKP